MASSSSSSSPSSLKIPKDEEEKEEKKLRLVLKYHNQMKHSFTGYAKGPRGLDWVNKPNPFHRYLSAPLIPLQHDELDDDSIIYSSLFNSLPPPKPISLSTISHFLYHSLALSSWKTAGLFTWPLCVNPISRNLHPTKAYLIAPPINSLSESAFVAHYTLKQHSLEVRAQTPSTFSPNSSQRIHFSSEFLPSFGVKLGSTDSLSGLIIALTLECLVMQIRICGGCNSVIEHEGHENVLGVIWHSECFCCDACHKPIAIQEVENHVRKKKHLLMQNLNSLITYREHHFWKERYYPTHEPDGNPKCCSCERLEEACGTKYVLLDDGRWLCLECMETSVMDTSEFQPLYFEIREFFQG